VTEPEPFVAKEPGIYLGVPDDQYHADPVPGGSLSSTGARELLPPSCPALFRHKRGNPQPAKKAFDFGKAAHAKVLGVGAELVVVPGERWDTKAAKQAVAEAREAGLVPVKQADMDRVDAMAAALAAHPFAGKLLRPGSGHAEASMFWVDAETQITCRTRVDLLPDAAPDTDRLIVPDYKTTASAALDDLRRSIWTFGLHQQADWIATGIRALGVHPNPTVVFVCQEKDPPYLVTVAQPDPFALKVGAHLNREARHLYRECTESGRWPGYAEDVALISLPGWVENQYAQELM
jgi:hypothetical protein